MNVLYYSDRVNRGGAETLVLDVCRNARSAGIDITFVAGGGGDLEAEFAGLDDYHRIDRRFSIDPFQLIRLRRLIKDRGIQIVHAQQPIDGLVLYLATIGTRIKRVLSLQSYLVDDINRRIARFVIPRMDAVCPVSGWMKKWFQAEEGFDISAKAEVIYNGVDASRLVPSRSQSDPTLRSELGIDGSAPLLGMVGHFYADQRKDQLTICRAMPAILKSCPDAHFVFVGKVYEGAEEYYLKCVEFCAEHGISDRIHFVGQRRDVTHIIGELDLFVFSTIQEGLPVAGAEALFLGAPMIASDIPPMLELVGAQLDEGPCAEIFRTGDANDLAAKVIGLLQNPDRLRDLSERARRQMPQRFGIDTHLRTLRTFYERLVTEK